MPLDIEQVRALRPANEIHYFSVIGSTMTQASCLVAAGAPHGAVVVADEQSAGIGRLGRHWISEPGVGIYCSVLLRLSLPPAKLPVASLVAGLAVAEAIHKSTELACDLRWPNDVLIRERKTAGILTQLTDDCVIAGIGINVNNTQFPDGLRTPPTSLLLSSYGKRHSREGLLIQLLASLEGFSNTLVREGSEPILRAFTAASSYAANRRVIVEESGARGITAGLDEHGFLLLRTDEGLTQRVSSGGVRPESMVRT
jgi:BirA family biotin operon repressor/biotin-[acetyl-CoA-carboxylase] ligase